MDAAEETVHLEGVLDDMPYNIGLSNQAVKYPPTREWLETGYLVSIQPSCK